MPRSRSPVVVAAVQAAPVFLELDATLDRCCDLVAEAAANGASLVVLPEAFCALPAGEWLNPGDSVIVDPGGKYLAGPLHECQGILYAELDLAGLAGPRSQLDVAGHYARPDIFRLHVDRRARQLARLSPVEPARARDVEDRATPPADVSPS